MIDCCAVLIRHHHRHHQVRDGVGVLGHHLRPGPLRGGLWHHHPHQQATFASALCVRVVVWRLDVSLLLLLLLLLLYCCCVVAVVIAVAIAVVIAVVVVAVFVVVVVVVVVVVFSRWVARMQARRTKVEE